MRRCAVCGQVREANEHRESWCDYVGIKHHPFDPAIPESGVKALVERVRAKIKDGSWPDDWCGATEVADDLAALLEDK